MRNIKISYLYRDAGNYKNFNEVVFANPERIDMEQAKQIIDAALIEGLYFVAKDWGLKDLHFDDWDCELDHCWHEFESVELTDEEANQKDSFIDFISKLK